MLRRRKTSGGERVVGGRSRGEEPKRGGRKRCGRGKGEGPLFHRRRTVRQVNRRRTNGRVLDCAATVLFMNRVYEVRSEIAMVVTETARL